jgi:S1-C subfamily serine protease
VQQLTDMPRQQYVEAANASPLRIGMGTDSGGGPRVTLGVVPDYSSFGAGGGVRISGTSPQSPAAAAGLKGGDVIVQYNETKIDTLYDLSDVLAKGKPGQKVKVKVLRDGGKTPVELEATLAERK